MWLVLDPILSLVERGLPQSRRLRALREAQNAPIQGGSADVLKLQMAAVMGIATPFAQIHDELDFYLPEDKFEEMAPVIQDAMEGIDCPFKLKVEVEVGPSMGRLEKWVSTR